VRVKECADPDFSGKTGWLRRHTPGNIFDCEVNLKGEAGPTAFDYRELEII